MIALILSFLFGVICGAFALMMTVIVMSDREKDKK